MEPFWRTKTLEQMTRAEFESICDGCARCCLLKLEDEDTGATRYTDIACRLLDTERCRCTDYARRRQRVRDCLKITPHRAESLQWLPPTCGYRLVAEGKPLEWWHPLVSGDPMSVHRAGISVRGRIFAREREVPKIVYPLRIVEWPMQRPKVRRRRRARKVARRVRAQKVAPRTRARKVARRTRRSD
jgi:uncharacterized cysteine cluster protein YcgN (CxxCxxCC family)